MNDNEGTTVLEALSDYAKELGRDISVDWLIEQHRKHSKNDFVRGDEKVTVKKGAFGAKAKVKKIRDTYCVVTDNMNGFKVKFKSHSSVYQDRYITLDYDEAAYLISALTELNAQYPFK